MTPDLLDDLLDRSAPATRGADDVALAAMIAEARVVVAPPPRRKRRLGIPASTARGRYQRAKEEMRAAPGVTVDV